MTQKLQLLLGLCAALVLPSAVSLEAAPPDDYGVVFFDVAEASARHPWIANVDGTHAAQLASINLLSMPKLAQGIVVFMAQDYEGHGPGIYKMEAVPGAPIEKIPNTENIRGTNFDALDISPDGSRVVWAGFEPGDRFENHNLYVIDTDGANKVRIRRNTGQHHFMITWGEPGRILLSISNVFDPFGQRVHEINPDGTGLAQVFPSFAQRAHAGGPDAHVAFTLTQSGPYLATAENDFSQVNPVPGLLTGYDFVSWHPLERTLYGSKAGSIYEIDPATGQQSPIVSATAGGAFTRFFGGDVGSKSASTSSPGFTISSEGRLIDADGDDFTIKGVNEPHHWHPRPEDANEEEAPTITLQALKDIASLGMNTVRVVLGDGRYPGRPSDADHPETISAIIASCRMHYLTCILEYHDTSGYSQQKPGEGVRLSEAVTFWKRLSSISPDGPAWDVLSGTEDVVLINIGNEPFADANAAWAYDTVTAIVELRKAGLRHTLIVDAPDFGQDKPGLVMRNSAEYVLDAVNARLKTTGVNGPNTMFSVHMYEQFDQEEEVRNYLEDFIDNKLPIMIGEFGPRFDGRQSRAPFALADARDVMRVAEELRVGYLAWSWSGNTGGDEELDLVTEFDVTKLTKWGRAFFGSMATMSITKALESAADADFRAPSSVRRRTLQLQIRILEVQFVWGSDAGIIGHLQSLRPIVDAWMIDGSIAKAEILGLIDGLLEDLSPAPQ